MSNVVVWVGVLYLGILSLGCAQSQEEESQARQQVVSDSSPATLAPPVDAGTAAPPPLDAPGVGIEVSVPLVVIPPLSHPVIPYPTPSPPTVEESFGRFLFGYYKGKASVNHVTVTSVSFRQEGHAIITDADIIIVDTLFGLVSPARIAVPGGVVGDRIYQVGYTPLLRPGMHLIAFLKNVSGQWSLDSLSVLACNADGSLGFGGKVFTRDQIVAVIRGGVAL